MMRLRNLGLLALAALLALALAPHAHGFESTVVFRSGMEPPPLPGAEFAQALIFPSATAFSTPVLNDGDEILFRGSMTEGVGGIDADNDVAVFGPDGAGGFRLVIQEGEAVPDLPGAPVGDPALFQGLLLNGLLLNDQGQVGYGAILQAGTGGLDPSPAIHRALFGPIGAGEQTFIAGAGVTPPGVPGTKLIGFRNPNGMNVNEQGPFLLNEAGDVVFLGLLEIGAGTVTLLDNTGIWGPVASGDLGLVARELDPTVPGTPFGTFWDDLFPQSLVFPQLNGAAQVGFTALLSPFSLGGLTLANDSGIWLQNAAGTLELLAREGSPALDKQGAFGAFTWGTTGLAPEPASAFAGFDLNNAGEPAFVAFLNQGPGGVTGNNNVGLWGATAGNGTALLWQKGEDAPGVAGGTFLGFGPPHLNASGDLLFLGSLNEEPDVVTNENDSGLWFRDGFGALELIARECRPEPEDTNPECQPPDTPPGTRYAAFLGGSPFSRMALTESGYVAFVATIEPADGGANRSAIFVRDPSGDLRLAHSPSSMVETEPGVFLQTGFVPRLHAASDDWVNDLGHVAFSSFVGTPPLPVLGFIDEAIILVTEPGAKPECMDGFDNDLDGRLDLADPGCDDPEDASEHSNLLVCDDGIDNDGDGDTDVPEDIGCRDFDDPSEEFDCEDGFDNEGDGLVDFPVDKGCNDAQDPTEERDCDDGLDNDGDGFTDLLDPGCSASPGGKIEDPQCNDGLDNDQDGDTDLDDVDCDDASDNDESPAASGRNRICAVGNELLLVLLPLLGLARLRRRRTD